MMGVGMGRNPNGAVTEINEAYRPVAAVRPLLLATLSCIAVLLVLRGTGAIPNWWFVALLVGVLVVAPGAAGVYIGRREREAAGVDRPKSIEWAGVDYAFDDEHLAVLAREADLGGTHP
jgi:hypothetical protein